MSFIDVPNVPGVPPLPSYSPNNIVLLVADAIAAIIGFFAGPQWGIFLNGAPVLSYDNQVSFGYKQDWALSNYPVEQGAFQTYDKVQLPSEIRCRFSAGASVTNRESMLSSVDAVMSDTNLYDVVTPENVFLGYNFTHRDYDRAAENVGLIVIDVWLQEIMETATAQYQNTSTPAVAGQNGLGNVSTSTPSSAVQGGVSGNFN
jgi:hypothetical protein